MDRPTGRVIRRYEHPNPGDLVHLDVKKLGKVPPGGGKRFRGEAAIDDRAKKTRKVGWSYVHAAIDDHSRLAYAEVHDNEKATTAVEFWARAAAFYASHGIEAKRVLTDNGACYRSNLFNAVLADTGIKHKYTRPYRPQTNGKIERFNRTLADEWAFVRAYRSESQRRRQLDKWLHTYNHHRCHTAIGGQPPITRVNNHPDQYT
jgi:transposase InsO family protein